MSIYKSINGSNDNRQFLKNMCDYVTDDAKTDGKKWVGTSSCSEKHPLEDMYTTKKLCHKTHGKQGEHFVLSLTPDMPSVEDSVYMDVAEEIALFYHQYQCIYALHKDSDVRHLHFILNSVSFKDGKKFSQSPSDLNRVKMRINDILEKYHFDIIRTSAADFRDTSDHSNEEGFDYLEVEEPPQSTETPEDVNIDIPGEDDDEDGFPPKDSNSKCKAVLVYKESEENTMNTPSIPQQMLSSAAPTAPYPVQGYSQPAFPQPEMPEHPMQPLPTFTINAAATFRIMGYPISDLNGMAPLTQELSNLITLQQKQEALKMGMAVYDQLKKRGYEPNICINTAPTIELNFNDPDLNTPNIIDVAPNPLQ